VPSILQATSHVVIKGQVENAGLLSAALIFQFLLRRQFSPCVNSFKCEREFRPPFTKEASRLTMCEKRIVARILEMTEKNSETRRMSYMFFNK
jgi:hypothetical protein